MNTSMSKPSLDPSLCQERSKCFVFETIVGPRKTSRRKGKEEKGGNREGGVEEREGECDKRHNVL